MDLSSKTILRAYFPAEILINLVCCPCLISQPPNHMNDNLVTIDEKADITEQ